MVTAAMQPCSGASASERFMNCCDATPRSCWTPADAACPMPRDALLGYFNVYGKINRKEALKTLKLKNSTRKVMLTRD
jgi:hypothetical protein